ncbi:hypothetical protein BC936DRAFT_146074 [Jimgerdemannia flammicorona]|uniref:Acyl-CoA dehydrogenase/oxidase n=1 Tax=Jimgerdemannia flammicorona TaxID=994334 RepID=A0A433D8F4_9FUNG|nr:hypothetical protein BC936DRAFT_146074 [Jimgerdemannia flammicorona]
MVANAKNGYFQEVPKLGNQYDEDPYFRSILRRLLPTQVLEEITPDLRALGQSAVEEIAKLGDQVEDPANHPRLKQYDAWCQRVDEIQVTPAWKQLHAIAAKEGLIAIAYERKYGEHSRIYQFAKHYLYAPSSAMYDCPLSMTDGAARVIELLGSEQVKAKYLPRLISRDPNVFWTSGQWMTERPGGSDVGGTETEAELIDASKNMWSISGFKWFSSATTSDMAMLLARTKDPKSGEFTKGSKGLSLFLAEMRGLDGKLNGVRVHRLKDKYGTRGLPTAELELEDMRGTLIGNLGRGVPSIASILNITRIYSALGGITGLRRSLALAKEYAKKRVAFNKPLRDLPLHIVTLAELELTLRATTQLFFYEVQLLGRTECTALGVKGQEHDATMLRFVTPVVKAYAAKAAVHAIGEAMEALGGQGYMEDVGIARQLRDAQVNTIWEGTTNVLALDVLRVLRETKCGVLAVFKETVHQKLQPAAAHPTLHTAAAHVRTALDDIESYIYSIRHQEVMEAGARGLTFAVARALAGALLVEHAAWAAEAGEPGAEVDVAVAERWCAGGKLIEGLVVREPESIAQDVAMVYGSDAKL